MHNWKGFSDSMNLLPLYEPTNSPSAFPQFTFTHQDVMDALKESWTHICESSRDPSWLEKKKSWATSTTPNWNSKYLIQVFPSSFRHTKIEEPTLHTVVLFNYHPISSLLFLRNLREKLPKGQPQAHFIAAPISDLAQSRFRKGHGTETFSGTDGW